jgi:hypothetical protein
MPKKFLLLCISFYMYLCQSATAQTIRGEVIDNEDKGAISGVSIDNIYTSVSVLTGSDGKFDISAEKGQLLEFRKPGYKTVRVRIPQGYVPPYFKIILQQGFSQPRDQYLVKGDRYDYTQDSIRFHDLYKHELDFPTLSTFDMIAHPFSALSKKNREIWRFQEEYDEFEKEKYVDRTFNEQVVTKFTGLRGDSLRNYMRIYRPTYDQLRTMNDYNFFNFIKRSVDAYRRRETERGAQ